MPTTAASGTSITGELIADLSAQSRRLRLASWATGAVGLLASWALSSAPAVLGGYLALLLVAGGSVGFAYVAARMSRPNRPAALPPSGTPPGFATVASVAPYAGGVLLLAGAGLALARMPSVSLVLVLLAVLLIHRPARLVLRPGAVEVRRLRTRSVPWSTITAVTVPPPPDGRSLYRHHGRLSLHLRSADGVESVLRVALDPLDVDAGFLRRVIEHYRTVPEDRTAIGAPAELARRRADHAAAQPAATAKPGAVAVPAVRPSMEAAPIAAVLDVAAPDAAVVARADGAA